MVLDLGCDSWYGSAELIKLGANIVQAVDIDEEAIVFAKKNYAAKNLLFTVSDAKSLPFKNQSFDVIVSFEVIEHIKDYRRYLKEVLRVLKKNDYFIFSTPNRNKHRGGTSPYHFKEFTPLQLRALFEEIGLLPELFGQFFTNQQFVKSEKKYFVRYQKLTFGGNKIIKKILHLVSPKIKASFYQMIWGKIPEILDNEVIIDKKNIEHSITLVGIAQKSQN